MKLIRLNLNAGWFGISKWGLKDDLDIIVGQIAIREDYTIFGKRGKIYTAFYPDEKKGEWVYKEFLKFREALEWLREEVNKKWQ